MHETGKPPEQPIQPRSPEHPTRAEEAQSADWPSRPIPPEDLDWFRQQPLPAADPHIDADPVLTVWQIPRFRFSSRRFTGRVDHALVCVTRAGMHETFAPPDRPTSVRRYVAVYEVDTDAHAFRLNLSLPSLVDSFEFEATTDITWQVTDPALFVQSREHDVPGLVTRELVPLLRQASRRHLIEASAEAEQDVRHAVLSSPWLGEAQGLRITCTVRLRRDAAERSHQARLRAARHEAEAAGPEQRAFLRRERYEAKRKAEMIKFYESVLARGGVAALALHLAAHPEETPLVLEHLRTGQEKLIDTQMHLIERALDGGRLDDDQLEEPHELIAERMTALLRTTGFSDAEASQNPRLPPQPPAVEPIPPKDSPEFRT